MEQDGDPSGERSSRDTTFTRTDIDASKKITFQLQNPLDVLEKEYLQKIEARSIKQIENLCSCSISFDVSSVPDEYIIKVKCSQGDKDIIAGEISKIRKDIRYKSTPFVSENSKLGRLLLNSNSAGNNQCLINIEEMKEENHCLLLTYRNKSNVPSCIINEERKKSQRRNSSENKEESKVYAISSFLGGLVLGGLVGLPRQIWALFSSKPKTNACLEPKLLDNKKGIQIGDITIRYKIGGVASEAAHTDAIICISSPNSYKEGPIASELAETGGYSYYFKYFLNYCLSTSQIISVGGSSFKCEKVYYIRYLCSGQSVSWLMERIEECLDKANDAKMTSISIPAIIYEYTGLNNDDCAKYLIDTIIKFARKDKKYNHLKTVNVIIWSKDDYESSFRYAMDLIIDDSMKPKHTDNNQINYVSPSSTHNPPIKKTNNVLLFSANYCFKADAAAVKINVYDSCISSGHSDAIINVLDSCDKHKVSEVLFHEVGSTYKHNYASISNRHNRKLRSTIYDVCSCDCLAAFTEWLIAMNDHGKTSVAISLLSTELDIDDIQNLIKSIEQFAKQDSIELKEINFILGRLNQAQEIATWMADCISGRCGENPWEIRLCCQPRHGIKAAFVGPDLKSLNDMKSSLKKHYESIKSRESRANNLSSMPQDRLQELRLDIWNTFNVILTQRSQDQGYCMNGYDDDVYNATDAVYEYINTLKVK